MKKLLALTALLATTAQAGGIDAAYCTQLSGLAEGIMAGRQGEVSLSKMMSIANGGTAQDELAQKMILSAYKEPKYSVEKNKKEAILEFQNKWASACFGEIK